MKRTFSRPPFFVIFLLMAGVSIVVNGCVSKTEPPPPPPPVVVESQDDELRKLNEQLTGQLKYQKQLTAEMQLKMLEKHTEVDRLTVMNERLVSEFVRNKSKLQNWGGKAETVRLIAEVDTVITTVKEGNPAGSQRDVLARAEKYLSESKSELEKGNVGGASYLASQALEQVQEIQFLAGEAGRKDGGAFVGFVVPLHMKLLKTSNVRMAPSIQAKVKFVAGAGHDVLAVGYEGQWVKVSIEGRGEGWIHYVLLH